MRRRDEVEVFAATFGRAEAESIRRILRGLDESALDLGVLRGHAHALAARVAMRPGLAWPAFLLALEAAELRLGGSVEFGTPKTRFDLSSERWGKFAMFEAMTGEEACLELVRARAGAHHGYTLRCSPVRSHESYEALAVLTGEIEDWIGVAVRLDEELRAGDPRRPRRKSPG